MLHIVRTHGALSEYEGNLPTPSAGSVNTAFLMHPLALEDAARMTPVGASSKLARWLTKANQSPAQRSAIRRMFFDPALKELDGRIVGHYALRARRRQSFGALLFIPYLPEDFLDEAKHEEILGSIRRAAVFARDSLGVGCLGLGAFTSITTRTTLTTEQVIPNTSGSHGTAIGIHDGVVRAMRELQMNPKKSRIVIVGATGAVGRPTCLLLAKRFGSVTIVARNVTKLRRLADELTQYGVAPEAIRICDASHLNTAVSEGDVVVLATSAADASHLALNHEAFRPGCIIVDAGRPRSLEGSTYLTEHCLRLDGAIFTIPGRVEGAHLLNMGGAKSAFGCLSETMLLGLLGDTSYESPRDLLTLDRTNQIATGLRRFRFRIGGFRIGDEPLDPQAVPRIRAVRKQHAKAQLLQPRLGLAPS